MSLNNWNEPAWTLSTEWLAYILFPVFLWAAKLPRSAVSALGVAVVLPLFYGIVLARFGSPVENFIDDVSNARMVAAFGAGCLACQASRRLTRVPTALMPLAFALIALAVLWPVWRVMAMVGFVLLVLVAARDQGRLGRFLASRPLVFLGDISFSVYLLHIILLNVLSFLFGIDATLSIGPRLIWMAGFLGLTVALAALSYRFIEQPARRIGRNWAMRFTADRSLQPQGGNDYAPRQPSPVGNTYAHRSRNPRRRPAPDHVVGLCHPPHQARIDRLVCRPATRIGAGASHTIEFEDIFRDAVYHPDCPVIGARAAMSVNPNRAARSDGLGSSRERKK